MTFIQWFQNQNLSISELAELLGHKRTETIRRWLKGETIPQKRHREKLVKVSNGEITSFI